MCRMLCLIAFLPVALGLANSWDIAVTTGDQIEFYSNKSKTSFESSKFKELTALAYDAVHNMLLFVDKQNDNASIFSFNLMTKKYQPLVGRRSNENIQGVAFDPVTNKMFWTDTNERSIYWISLWPRSKDNIYGNLLLKMKDEIPRDIAIDSCRGYIYWTNTNIKKATIERARLDGTERTVIIDSDIYMPVSITVDQHSRKLYWADDKEGIHFTIETSNLDGSGRKTLLAGTQHQPNSITVSKDSIYWVDWGYKQVWILPKNATPNSEPEEFLSFNEERTFGIVANYNIADQTNGIKECKNLATLSQTKTVINDTTPILEDLGLFCLHGKKTDIYTCQCSTGYTGKRCETSVCHNYCLRGECSVLPSGFPTCKCPAGFVGERCEVNPCDNHCVHGTCSVSGVDATCTCEKGYTGVRCEKVIQAPVEKNCTTETTSPTTKVVKSNDSTLSQLRVDDDEVYLDGCGGWDPVRDPILMVLGIVCGLLTLACAVLITKILHLRRRPRIKKRIIVNKNVTPLTARPDQCEITIENCCNMNICETPCFEPRNNIRPTLLDAKPGKEEKRNLIANMEGDDY
ncbi:protein cueball [Aricia agestis]|uniref:protein cueball n=1 Tax=Aricia agestis TaxID=91739 RepID=UPI001C20BB42|nr:protein cueball [Aricia agestis]